MLPAVVAASSDPSSAYTRTPPASQLDFHRRMAERARRQESPAWRRAGFVPGACVAEIGCGSGMVLAELAAAVAPGGRVIGVEADAGMRATASDVLRSRAVRNAQVVAGDAADTGLARGSCDAIMMRHVLVQNGRYAADVVRHLATRLRSGGALYLVETDVEALRFLPYERHLEEQRMRFLELLTLLGNDLSIGSKLDELVIQSGLELVEWEARWDIVPVDTSVGRALAAQALPAMRDAGLASPRDCERWDAAWTRFAADPVDKVVFTPMLHAIGRRRGPH